MARKIYLAIFSNGTKPAHWSIWIPSLTEEGVGKMLHATGSPATGFFLEFYRNYNLENTTRSYQTLFLGDASDQHVTDTPQVKGKDTIARDRFESTATTVMPPGRSANPFDQAALNCQNWIIDFVEKLIEEGFITADARAVLQSAPKII